MAIVTTYWKGLLMTVTSFHLRRFQLRTILTSSSQVFPITKMTAINAGLRQPSSKTQVMIGWQIQRSNSAWLIFCV